jgi:DNA-binding transcriptional MerR regulator
MTSAEIPNRSLFKAPEVCEIAQLQPYVLRSWEAEFPDLGVTRAGAAGRVYRRHDLERVLRLKHLLFVEGLTLAGARRRLEEERVPLPALDEAELAAPARPRAASATQEAEPKLRRHLAEIRHGLRALLAVLDGKEPTFELKAQPHAAEKPKPASKGNGRHATRRPEPKSRGGRRSR